MVSPDNWLLPGTNENRILSVIISNNNNNNNNNNNLGTFDEDASPGRVAGGQQPAPGRYPATAAQESGSRKGRRKWSVEENRVLMECYFKSISEKRGYRQRMLRLWDEKGW